MSVWTTKATSRTGEFIILKHSIRGVNYNIKGVRFRDGYAVVEKDSKTYFELKKMPILRKAVEYNLTYLGKLSFITRSFDIQQVYGKDVYHRYLKAVANVEEKVQKEKEIKEEIIAKKVETEHIEEEVKCQYRLGNGNLCRHDAEQLSPSKYCRTHLLEDKKLADFNIDVPLVPSKEKKQLRKKILRQLEKLLKTENKPKIELEEIHSDGQTQV